MIFIQQKPFLINSFNPIALSYLKNFKADNFYPFLDKCEDPIEALATAKRTDYILLPAGNYNFNLFEHGKSRGPDTALIDHRKLHETLKTIDKKWLLLYKSHPILFKMYNDHNIIMVDKRGRKVSNKSNCAELIIANFQNISGVLAFRHWSNVSMVSCKFSVCVGMVAE